MRSMLFCYFWEWFLFLNSYLGLLGTLVFLCWDNSPSCLLSPPLVCIAGWSDCILRGIRVVLPKSSTWDHGRTYLIDDDSNALGSIQSRWSWQCVHTRGRGSRWQGDAHRGMCHRCLLLLECRDAIGGLPPSSRCSSCLWSLSRILEGAAPIV